MDWSYHSIKERESMKRSVKSTWTNFSSKLTTKERNTLISSSLDQTQTILWETGFNFWFSFGSYPITWLNPNPNARTLVKKRCARANCLYTSCTCVHHFSKTGPKWNELVRIIHEASESCENDDLLLRPRMQLSSWNIFDIYSFILNRSHSR